MLAMITEEGIAQLMTLVLVFLGVLGIWLTVGMIVSILALVKAINGRPAIVLKVLTMVFGVINIFPSVVVCEIVVESMASMVVVTMAGLVLMAFLTPVLLGPLSIIAGYRRRGSSEGP